MANYALPISDDLGELLQSQGAPVIHLESSFPLATYSVVRLREIFGADENQLEECIRIDASAKAIRNHIASVILESRGASDLRHLVEAYNLVNCEEA